MLNEAAMAIAALFSVGHLETKQESLAYCKMESMKVERISAIPYVLSCMETKGYSFTASGRRVLGDIPKSVINANSDDAVGRGGVDSIGLSDYYFEPKR